jgi:chromosome segregation ATPase
MSEDILRALARLEQRLDALTATRPPRSSMADHVAGDLIEVIKSAIQPLHDRAVSLECDRTQLQIQLQQLDVETKQQRAVIDELQARVLELEAARAAQVPA